MLKIKKAPIFFFLFLFFNLFIISGFVQSADYIVSYEQFTQSDEIIFSKDGNITQNNFAEKTMINFNIANTTNFSRDYSNMIEFTDDNDTNVSIDTTQLPRLGSSPVYYYSKKALRVNSSIANRYVYVNHTFDDTFNLTTENPYSAFVSYFYAFMVSNNTDLSTLSIKGSSNTALLLFNWEYDTFRIYHQYPSYIKTVTGFMPSQLNYAFVRVLVQIYTNTSIKTYMNFYDSTGAIVHTEIDTTTNSFTTDYLYDNVRLANRVSDTGFTFYYLYWIDCSHNIFITNHSYSHDLLYGQSNDYNRLYFSLQSIEPIFNFINESNGNRIENISGQIPIFIKQYYSGPNFYYHKYKYRTTDSVFQTNVAYVYDSIIDTVDSNMKLRADFETNMNSSLNFEFTNNTISIIKNSTDYCIHSKTQNVNLTNPYLSIRAIHYLNRIQLIVIDDLYQHVFTEFLINERLLNISFANLNIANLDIKKSTVLSGIIDSDWIYNTNYYLEYTNEDAFVSVTSHTIELIFPIRTFPISEVFYQNKKYYPYILFISKLESNISGNNSFNGYYSIRENYHFLHSSNVGYTEYNDSFYSDLGSADKIPNGGTFLLTINLFSNTSDFTEIEYTVTANYAYIYSTDLAFESFFQTGMNLILPLVILTIFAYGMYSDSKSKFMLGFGFLLGIVVLFLTDMISIGSLILFLILTLVMIGVFIKKENRGHEL